MTLAFQQNAIPELIFQRNGFLFLAAQIKRFGRSALILSDGYIETHPQLWEVVQAEIKRHNLEIVVLCIDEQTTREGVRFAEEKIASLSFECVVSIGGSRIIDVGKIVSQNTAHIAIPTTHGSGAPMNSIIFDGRDSDRETQNDHYLADVVIADATFLDDMSRLDFACRALSILNLLMDAYVCDRSTPISDALIWSGLETFRDGFLAGLEGDQDGRDKVFYAALIAGIGSAQNGFGWAHRFATVIEQKTSLSYSQISATLSGEICDVLIERLNDFFPDHSAIDKYAMIGELLAERPFDEREEAFASLIGTLRRWVSRLEVPKMTMSDTVLIEVQDLLVSKFENETGKAFSLSEEAIEIILRRRLL